MVIPNFANGSSRFWRNSSRPISPRA